MSVRPVHVVRASGLQTGRDAIWSAIRQLTVFTLDDIVAVTQKNRRLNPVTVSLAKPYVQGLEAAGFVALVGEVEQSGQLQSQWKLTKNNGVNAPRVRKNGDPVMQGRNREQMWQTMWILKEFNARDLAVAAATKDVPVSDNTAKDYIYNLHKAGYLIQTQAAKNSGGLARYRALPSMHTGPKPPMVQRIKQVFDPNINQVVWPKEGESC